MGLNVLALLRHLSTSPTSPLPRLAESGYTKPSTVFFLYLGWFFVYSFERAKCVYAALAVGAIGFVLFVDKDGKDGDEEEGGEFKTEWRREHETRRWVRQAEIKAIRQRRHYQSCSVLKIYAPYQHPQQSNDNSPPSPQKLHPRRPSSPESRSHHAR
jgi:hypothetical protein